MTVHLKKLIIGSGMLFGYRVAGAILTFLTQVFLVRWIGADEFGQYIWTFSLATLLGNLVALGLIPAAPRLVHLARSNQDQVEEKSFLLGGYFVVVIVSILLGLGLWVFSLLQARPVEQALLLAIALVPVFGIARFSSGISVTNRWMTLAFLPNRVIRPLLFLIVAVLLWQAGQQLTTPLLMWVQLIVSLITALIIISPVFYRSRHLLSVPGVNFRFSFWLRVSMPMMGIALMTEFFPEVILILFQPYLSNTDLSITSAALRFMMLVTFVLISVDTFISPDIAELAAAGKFHKLQRVARRSARVRAVVSLAALVVFALFGKYMLAIFGPEFTSGYVFLLLLGVGQFFMSLFGPCAQVLMLSGHQDRSLLASLVSVSVLAIEAYFLIPSAGLTGAGVAALLATMTWILILYHGVRQKLNIRTDVFS